MQEEDEEMREAKESQEKELEYCKLIGLKLADRLRERAFNNQTDEDFTRVCREWAKTLCEAPGGPDLVRMTSQAWRIKAKKYAKRFWGLESFLAQIKDFSSYISQGFSLFRGFLRTSRMTKEAVERKRLNQTGVQQDRNTTSEEETKRTGEGDDEEMSIEMDEADVKKIAKQGLDVIWRLGMFLLQNRVRKVVDCMFQQEQEHFLRSGLDSRQTQVKMKSLAMALLELGHHFKQVWEEYCLAHPDKKGSPIQLE